VWKKAISENPLFLHTLVLFLASLIWLPVHESRLFNGLDGDYMRILVRQQWAWMPFGPALGMNVFQGLGNAFYPTNMNLIPAFLIQSSLSLGDPWPALTYAIFGVELFLATYFWGRLIVSSRTMSLVAAWGLVLLALPFLYKPLWRAEYQITPQLFDLLVLQVAFLWCMATVGEKATAGQGVRCVVASLIPTYMVVSNPLISSVFFPTMGVMGIALILFSETKRVRLIRLLMVCAASLVIVASGVPSFVLGNTLFSVPAFFADELVRHQDSLGHASIVFQYPTYPAGAVVVPLSVLGSISLIRSGSRTGRRFAWLHLLLSGGYILGGALAILFLPSWRGPQGQYFEYSLWPSYALYATAGIRWIWNLVASYITLKFDLIDRLQLDILDRLSPVARSENVTVLLIPLCALCLTVLGPKQAGGHHFPPNSSPIVDVLRSELALKPGAPFRGYTATFTGLEGDAGIGWMEQHAFDQGVLVPAVNNDHRFTGMWHFDVPTLNEYNHYTTPTLYLFSSRLLARPIDKQVRNVTTYTLPDENILRALGVRFVVADRALLGTWEPRLILPVKGGVALYLYELQRPNLGTFSPVTIRRVSTAGEVIEAIRHGIDFEKEVIVNDNVTESLIPAEQASLFVEPGGVRLAASSRESSLVLLPIQYSACLRMKANSPLPSNFRFIRANLVETAVVFSGELDVTISLANGPAVSSSCRLKDFKDVERLELREGAKSFPLRHYSFN
jgi:hypothetical protein